MKFSAVEWIARYIMFIDPTLLAKYLTVFGSLTSMGNQKEFISTTHQVNVITSILQAVGDLRTSLDRSSITFSGYEDSMTILMVLLSSML